MTTSVMIGIAKERDKVGEDGGGEIGERPAKGVTGRKVIWWMT
jgi:hypothetical protein